MGDLTEALVVALTAALFLLIIAAAIVGYVSNMVALVMLAASGAGVSAMLILYAVGTLFFPLGIVAGWMWLLGVI